jgi:hypothetical protein
LVYSSRVHYNAVAADGQITDNTRRPDYTGYFSLSAGYSKNHDKKRILMPPFRSDNEQDALGRTTSGE